MPIPLLKTFADKSNKSLKDVETLWDKTSELVNKDLKGDDVFKYRVGILKKMLNLKESTMDEVTEKKMKDLVRYSQTQNFVDFFKTCKEEVYRRTGDVLLNVKEKVKQEIGKNKYNKE